MLPKWFVVVTTKRCRRCPFTRDDVILQSHNCVILNCVVIHILNNARSELNGRLDVSSRRPSREISLANERQMGPPSEGV